MKNLLPILVLLLSLWSFDSIAQNEFITTWETTSPSESVTIPTFSSATYDYTVDWGDGNSDNNVTGDATHTYTTAGTHTVKISGTFPRMYFTFSTTSNDKIKTVEQWGNNQWTSMELAFYLCSNLTIEATDSPDLSNVTSLASMLAGCTNLTGDLSGWNVSNIQNFNNMFSDTENFSQDLTSWTVVNATSMAGMFRNSGFNGSLLGWDVSSVTTFSSIFSNSSFNNSSITGWNTQSVTDLSNAFLGNSVFNQDISGWKTSVVTDFSRMFENASAFNYDLDLWDVSSATDLSRMFAGATSFNGDISTWKTANVTTLFFMFAGATNYNQPMAYNASTGAWDLSNVTDIGYLFNDATSFNQDISNWNVSGVTNLVSTFNNASSFNQDISSWDVSNVTQMASVFKSADVFDQNLGSWNISNVTNFYQGFSNAGFSTENYDNTLIGWTDGSFTPPSNIISFQPSNLTYCDGASARQILDDTYNWSFSGDQQSCTPTAISLTSNSIDENNGIGNSIGELLATDNDVSENFTFTFVAGTGDADNSSFTINKGAISQRSFLRAAEVFDYETKSSYSARIQVEDKDGNTYEQELSILINNVAEFDPATAFITTWETSSANETIKIPTNAFLTTYNYSIDWGDGSPVESGVMGSASHEYNDPGVYTVQISGSLPQIVFQNEPDQQSKIVSIEQWGNIEWTSMYNAFRGCSNLVYNATDAPNLTQVTSTQLMFRDCNSFDGDLNNWDVSNVQYFNAMFDRADLSSTDLSTWDMSSAINTSAMFRGTNFNGDITGWTTSNVEDMSFMFGSNPIFNRDISGWDVSKVSSMNYMFNLSTAFNQNISHWNTSSVTSMRGMFGRAENFNQPIGNWDVSSVTTMQEMLLRASAFNQDLSEWDISHVGNMNDMFLNTSMTTANYDKMLISWSNLPSLQDNVEFDMLYVHYCNGEAARNSIINTYDWTISDFGKQCPNNAPTGISISSNGINENNEQGAVVGSLTTTDQDGSDSHSYSLVSGTGATDNTSFSINNGNLVADEVFDFETKSTYSVRLQTNDGNGGTFEDNFTITINDVNDVPTVITLSDNTIDENNAVDAVIGSFATSDQDGADTHTYSLVSGTSDTDNGSFTMNGDVLEAAEVFDFETKSSYSIRVQTDDGTGGTFEDNFTITINDVNDVPAAITLSDDTIDENNAVDAVIGSFATSDQDGADTHTYSLVSGAGDSDNGSFSISGENLEAAEVFDFETKSSYSIRVQTDDGKGGTFEESFTITINDVEEKQNQTITFDELTDKIYGDASFTLTASADSELAVNFELVSGPVSLNGNEVTITGTGTATVRATQAGNEAYHSAEPLDQSFDITKAGLTVSADDKIMTYGEALPALTYQIEGFVYSDDENDLSTAVEISTTADQNSNAGTYDITVSGATAANYDLSFEAGTLTVVKAAQEITFGELSDVDIDQSSELSLSATSSSSLAVSFEVVSGPATLNGNTLSLTGTGEVTIRANQAGNENFEAADPVTQSFNVTSGSKEDQTITFETLPEKTYEDAPFDLNATASSGLDVSYTSSDETVASVEGTTVIIIGAGTTTITASQAGNEEYNPAPVVSQTLTVNKADQEITIEEISDKDIEAADFEVVASTTSELELVYAILSGPATLNGNLISLTGEIGTVKIEVTQAGNANYSVASATISFDVVDDPCEGFAATASLIQNASCNGEVDGSFEVTTTAGTAPFTFSVGNESQDNGLFENMSAGSYEITVTDANGCTATTTVEITEPDAIEVTAEITDSNSINGNGSITLTVTGGSGNFTFDWSNGETTANLSDLEIGEYSVIITDEAGCNITESYTIGGVTANSEAFEVNIYPNPVINQVKVVHGEKVNQITLIDANGKIISQQKTEGEQTQLQMKALPAGMYFIRLDDGKMKRIIKD